MSCSNLKTSVARLDLDPKMNATESSILSTIQNLSKQKDPKANPQELCEQGSKLLSNVTSSLNRASFKDLADYEKAILANVQKPGLQKQESYPTVFDLRLQNAEGLSVPLKSYLNQGKIVVVVFWASWCGPCLEEVPELNRLAQKYPNQVSVVPIAIESQEDLKQASVRLRAKGIELPESPVLFDPDKQSYKAIRPTLDKVSVPYAAYYLPDGTFAGEKAGMSFSMTAGDPDSREETNQITRDIEGLLNK